MGDLHSRLAWLILIAAGMLCGVIAIELALRLLPVSKGLFLAYDSGAFPLPRYEAHLRWTHSIGWDLRFPVEGRTNNYGQVSPFDYVDGSAAVALIGDSFVEGQLNAYPDTLHARLADALAVPNERVYAFGLGGNSLSDYLATATIAARQFKLDALVFFIVDGDIRESLDFDRGHYRFVKENGVLRLHYEPLAPLSARGRALRLIGDSSLLFYAFSNLRFKPRDLLPSFANTTSVRRAPMPAAIPRNDAIIDAFLQGVAAIGIPADRVVFVVDSDRYALYRTAQDTPKDAPQARAHLIASARERGHAVVDMAPVFADDYARNRRAFDFHPLDRHLNAYGNSLAARSIATALGTPQFAGVNRAGRTSP
jgi:hypothetical protein